MRGLLGFVGFGFSSYGPSWPDHVHHGARPLLKLAHEQHDELQHRNGDKARKTKTDKPELTPPLGPRALCCSLRGSATGQTFFNKFSLLFK